MKNNIGFLIEETLDELDSEFEITIEEPPRRVSKIAITKAILIEPMALEQRQVNTKRSVSSRILASRRFLKSLIRF